MIIADVRYGTFSQVRPYLSLIVTPIQEVVNMPKKIFYWAGEHLESREGLVKENQELLAEILVLRSKQQRLESLQAENVRLRELLDASQRSMKKLSWQRS